MKWFKDFLIAVAVVAFLLFFYTWWTSDQMGADLLDPDIQIEIFE
jgi:hypothetical protein